MNTLTATIASLNQQIASISPNRDAGTLEDQRQAAIAQLSQYVGLDQISTENNGITLTTSNGGVLVSGGNSYAMHDFADGWYESCAVRRAGCDDEITGGPLGGVIAARETELPTVSSALDSLAYGIGTQVNQLNVQGVDGNGNPGQPCSRFRAELRGGCCDCRGYDRSADGCGCWVRRGSAGNTNAQALAGISTANIAGGKTADAYYASMLAQIGNATATATTNNTPQQATLTQLTTQRDSLSGVSLDDEAANLTQYQRSYQAAAKVFTIVDTMMASALNLGEQTTVS